jgi:hypothetical protein
MGCRQQLKLQTHDLVFVKRPALFVAGQVFALVAVKSASSILRDRRSCAAICSPQRKNRLIDDLLALSGGQHRQRVFLLFSAKVFRPTTQVGNQLLKTV